MTRVLILGGGPDAEREVSIASATAVHQGCVDAGLDATLLIVDRPTIEEVQSWDAEVVFPVLHGQFGEGGALQLILERAGVAFVGSRSRASRLAMDKLGTKLVALDCGIPTPIAAIFDPADVDHPEDSVCPIELPVVIKPVSDGSSVGLYLCTTKADWIDAVSQVGQDLVEHPRRVYMIERMIIGRELTASVLVGDDGELEALELIEIKPSQGVYDYNAKYVRGDTQYISKPELPESIVNGIKEHAVTMCQAIGVRHLARVDFLLDTDNSWTLLELNTMPGFTKTSLMPMAAKQCEIQLPALCAHLVGCAYKDHQSTSGCPTH